MPNPDIISIIRLDTVPPPLWEHYWGRENPKAGDPHTDAATALEYTRGEDPVNEYSSARAEGDLWRRDFVSESNFRRLVDYMATRSGATFNVPSVRLWKQSTLELVRIPVGSTDLMGWFYVAAGLQVTSGTEAGVSIRLHNLTDDTILVTDLASTLSWRAASLEDRGEVLDPDKEWAVRVHNESAESVTLSAWVMLQSIPFEESSSSSGSSSSSVNSSSSSSSSVNSSSSSTSSVNSSSSSSLSSSSSHSSSSSSSLNSSSSSSSSNNSSSSSSSSVNSSSSSVNSSSSSVSSGNSSSSYSSRHSSSSSSSSSSSLNSSSSNSSSSSENSSSSSLNSSSSSSF